GPRVRVGTSHAGQYGLPANVTTVTSFQALKRSASRARAYARGNSRLTAPGGAGAGMGPTAGPTRVSVWPAPGPLLPGPGRRVREPVTGEHRHAREDSIFARLARRYLRPERNPNTGYRNYCKNCRRERSSCLLVLETLHPVAQDSRAARWHSHGIHLSRSSHD